MADKGRLLPVDFSVDPLALHQFDSSRYPFLLQSSAGGTAHGRYDILFGFPGQRLLLDAPGTGPDFLVRLDQHWHEAARPAVAPRQPFAGGWFLLLGYELAAQVEPILDLPSRPGWPVAAAVRVPVALVRDLVQRRAWIVAEPGHAEAAEAMLADTQRCAWRPRPGPVLAATLAEPDPEAFIGIVERARAHIAAGDIFQANLSREWRGLLAPDVRPADLYARLRQTNPGPFAGLAVLDDVAVISSSPERLVASRDGRVDTRPIAGTRPRGVDAMHDIPLREELLGHPKERAEHIMLIDLERNDLGRVCRPGSVVVDEFMVIESYSHVHHIVSNVTGRLREDITPGQVLRAVFPGGTITGCPKVRCMQLIAELERRARGFYTGAMGYLNHDGSLDLNILIRTIETRGRELSLAAGSGIVADSEPERELEETRAKAKGMLLALE